MDDAATVLNELADQIRACPLCRLSQSRTHAVPGEGPPHARIMFIGEGPGQQEDLSGRPFVGAAGKLLNLLLLRAGLRRPDLFITNLVKCRPPGNRDPLPDEIAACRPYLDAQIATLNPRVVCLLGRPATQTMLGSQVSMSKQHGVPCEKDGLLFVPLYHPAAALHQPGLQPVLVADMQRLADLLGRLETAEGASSGPPFSRKNGD